jgi:hypothetical protein
MCELTLLLLPPTKSALITAGPYTSPTQNIAHNVFRVTAADASRTWLVDPTGPQFNIFTPAAKEDEYMARYAQRVTATNPLGTAQRLYAELCALPGVGAIHHAQRGGAVRAVQSGIEAWKAGAGAGVGLPGLLRLADEAYGKAEEGLLNRVRESVRVFTVLWDRKEDVERFLGMPKEVHMGHHEEAMRVFAKYGELGTAM